MFFSLQKKRLISLQTSPTKNKDSGNKLINITCEMNNVTNWPDATYFSRVDKLINYIHVNK